MKSPDIMIHAPSITAPRPQAGGLCDWASHGPLTWEQPVLWRSEWTLRAGDSTLATLRRDHWYSLSMTATTPRGAWKLDHSWLGKVTVRHGDAAQPVMVYQPGWFGRGTILRTGASPLLWRRPGFFSRGHEVCTDESFPVLRLRQTWNIVPQSGSVEFETAAKRLPDVEPLVLLALALHLASHHRHAAS